MRILVTGGAGFIGGHLAESFVADGHDVVVVDNFEPFYDIGIKQHTVEECRDVAESSDGTYRLEEGDIRDTDLVDDLVSEVDVIVHQAA